MSSLLFNIEIYIQGFENTHHLKISKEFAACMDKQLTAFFERQSGLKINKLICIGWAWEVVFFYSSGEVSRFASKIWVNHGQNAVTVAWKANSGKIYKIDDTDIDCGDIEFWFEDFDAVLYNKQFYPTFDLPFKLKNLSYELVVTRLNMDATIEMKVKKDETGNMPVIIEKIDAFIENFNIKSENKDRKYGVVHNWKRQFNDDNLIYEIDTGFTGAYFTKKILHFLSGINAFERVEVM
jgi:hypothetical protein